MKSQLMQPFGPWSNRNLHLHHSKILRLKSFLVEQGNLLVPPPHKTLQPLASSIDIQLHLSSETSKVPTIEKGRDVIEIAAAEIEGEADTGVELVLVQLLASQSD